MKQFIYKIIYQPSINKFLITINKILLPILPKKIKLPPSGVISLKNKEGKTLKLKTNQTNYLSQLVFWDGYLNFEYSDIFVKLIKKVNVFYDIGANIGYYSLLAEMENPNIKVVAFEPATGPLFFLKENVKINNLKNIKVETIALSDENGEITFNEIKNKKYTYLEHNLAGEGNAGNQKTHRNFYPIKVKSKTLNTYVLDNNEQNIDFIKMDTEGTEHYILNNSSTILDQMKPIIVCETLFNTIESELEDIFKKYGYDFYNHTEKGLQKVTTIIRKKDNGVRNCFFVPAEKFHLIEEFVY